MVLLFFMVIVVLVGIVGTISMNCQIKKIVDKLD
jgi:hypothetical protein